MPDAIRIEPDIVIPMSDIALSAIRARGAGGQHVNKVSTAVHLRFDVAACSALPQTVKDRLLALDDSRITADGVVVIKARQHRTRERNRREALKRLADLIAEAMVVPEARRPTRVPPKWKAKRIEEKRRRSTLKRSRRDPDID